MVNDALSAVRRRVPSINQVKTTSVVIGTGYTGVQISSGHVGLAYSTLGELNRRWCNISDRAGKLKGSSALELASLASSWDLSERVVGIAALNALSQLALENLPTEVRTYSGDVLDHIRVFPQDTVVFVGNMRPAVEKLKRRAKKVLVLERSLEHRNEEIYPDTAAEEIVPIGNVVLITGATLCNGTADRVLQLCKNARETVMVGASAGIFPPVLFKRGVTAVGTVKILKPETLMQIISEGGGTSALMKAVEFVTYKPVDKLK